MDIRMNHTLDDSQNFDFQQYNEYLNLLPIYDLRIELETLDEPCVDGAHPPFGLPQSFRSDLAFRCLLRRQFEGPLNSSPPSNEVKGALLEGALLVRLTAKALGIQELEYALRKAVAAIENMDDPDISRLQNLISILLRKAVNSPKGAIAV